MAKLIYSAICSLDGFTEDTEGKFDWAEPSPEVHAFVNELERSVGTYLLGRRMHETMVYWDTAPVGEDVPAEYREFAEIWQAADKVVYSRTLSDMEAPRTRLESKFDPAAVRQMKEQEERDLGIGGPELASQALAAGLVDELRLIFVPVIVGAGKPALPAGLHLALDLIEQRRFDNGTVYLSYGIGTAGGG